MCSNMRQSSPQLDRATPKRRYLIHISSVVEASDNSRQYLLSIQPWTSRLRTQTERQKRFISDECALAETLNPLLPSGSNVRDVLGYIENDGGFFYLLHLTSKEAELLGWRT
jgi:hypothetical protein